MLATLPWDRLTAGRNDLKIFSAKDVRALLTVVAIAHNQAAAALQMPEKHWVVVEIVQRILSGTNGVRY